MQAEATTSNEGSHHSLNAEHGMPVSCHSDDSEAPKLSMEDQRKHKMPGFAEVDA